MLFVCCWYGITENSTTTQRSHQNKQLNPKDVMSPMWLSSTFPFGTVCSQYLLLLATDYVQFPENEGRNEVTGNRIVRISVSDRTSVFINPVLGNAFFFYQDTSCLNKSITFLLLHVMKHHMKVPCERTWCTRDFSYFSLFFFLSFCLLKRSSGSHEGKCMQRTCKVVRRWRDTPTKCFLCQLKRNREIKVCHDKKRVG